VANLETPGWYATESPCCLVHQDIGCQQFREGVSHMDFDFAVRDADCESDPAQDESQNETTADE